MSFICPNPMLTTQRRFFTQTKPEQYAKRVDKILQSDVLLISGHFKHNLKVGELPTSTKTWVEPKLKDQKEEDYKEYLERLNQTKKKYYDIFFESPPVRCEIVGDSLKDSLRTTYQNSYSQNEFDSIHEITRLKKRQMDLSAWKSHVTTNNTYYSMINDISGLRELSIPIRKVDDKKALKDELIQIYKTGCSNYYRDTCIPAIEKRKKFLPGQLREGYVDRHIERRACSI